MGGGGGGGGGGEPTTTQVTIPKDVRNITICAVSSFLFEKTLLTDNTKLITDPCFLPLQLAGSIIGKGGERIRQIR